MPTDNKGQNYEHKSSGTNSSGNHYCARDYGSDVPNTNSYHYSNKDGSYYSNSDGSTYHNDGKGGATYAPPSSGGSGTAKK